MTGHTYILALLIHMPDLEPYVKPGERGRRVAEDTIEALEDRRKEK